MSMLVDREFSGADLLVQLIETNNRRGIIEAAQTKKINPCGVNCLAVLLSLFPDNCSITTLGRSVSSADSGKHSVEYAAFSLRLKKAV